MNTTSAGEIPGLIPPVRYAWRNPMTDADGAGEVTGLDQSIAYAQHLAAEAGQHGTDGGETYLTSLAERRVAGTAITTATAMQQAFTTAQAAAEAHAAELEKQKTVQQAYDTNPDAGDKDFQTGAAHPSTSAVPDAGRREAGTDRPDLGLMSGLGGDPDACLDWSVLHADGRRSFAVNGAAPVDLTQDEIRRLRIQLACLIDRLPTDGTLHPATGRTGAGRPHISWRRAANGNLRLECGHGDDAAAAELTDTQLARLHALLGQQLDIDADLLTPPAATTHDPAGPKPDPDPVTVAADVPAAVSGARIDRPRRANGWGALPATGLDHFHPDGAIGRAIDSLGADAALDVDGDSLANRLADLATRGTLCHITPQGQVDALRTLAARMPAGSTAARTLTMTADDLDAPAIDVPALPDSTKAPLAALVTALAGVPSVRRDPDRELTPLLELIRSGRAQGPLGPRRIRALINRRHESEEGKSYIDSLIRHAARDLESEASNTPSAAADAQAGRPRSPRPAEIDR